MGKFGGIDPPSHDCLPNICHHKYCGRNFFVDIRNSKNSSPKTIKEEKEENYTNCRDNTTNKNSSSIVKYYK